MIHPTTDNCPASTWLRDIGPILYIYILVGFESVGTTGT